jgi:uncharacterized protein (DUF1015 family)
VAPPYDAVGEEERAELYTRSPYNVVHVTLPDSAAEAGRLYRDWLASGVLEPESSEAAWIVAESYVGPDGVSRERHGLIASVAAEPYETGSVLPHERTHERTRDERLELLRETGVQPEPIFLLADAPLEVTPPDRPADLEADGSRLWRLDGLDLAAWSEPALLVADGHHRYEATVALGAGARVLALLVPTGDPGLQVFPTHRVFSGRPDLATLREGEAFDTVDDALRQIGDEPIERSAAVACRPGGIELVRGEPGELDVELVDRHGLEGISYTQRADEALAAVASGAADAAYVVRAPRVQDVFAAARRGERMPPKSTYFFPKPLSGLLFHPVDVGEPA